MYYCKTRANITKFELGFKINRASIKEGIAQEFLLFVVEITFLLQVKVTDRLNACYRP